MLDKQSLRVLKVLSKAKKDGNKLLSFDELSKHIPGLEEATCLLLKTNNYIDQYTWDTVNRGKYSIRREGINELETQSRQNTQNLIILIASVIGAAGTIVSIVLLFR